MSKGDLNSRPKIPDDFLAEMLGLSYLGFQHLVKVIEQLEGRSDPQAARLLLETLKNPSMNAYVADAFVESVLTKGNFNLETMKALIKAFFSTCEFQKRPEFFLSRFSEYRHYLLLSLPDRFQYLVFVAEQTRTQGYSKQLIDMALLDFSNQVLQKP